MIDCKEKRTAEKLEGLDKGSVGPIVVNGVHLSDMCLRVLLQVCLVIRIEPALKIGAVMALFVSGTRFLCDLT